MGAGDAGLSLQNLVVIVFLRISLAMFGLIGLVQGSVSRPVDAPFEKLLAKAHSHALASAEISMNTGGGQ